MRHLQPHDECVHHVSEHLFTISPVRTVDVEQAVVEAGDADPARLSIRTVPPDCRAKP
jgi:hypothetical protein